MRRYRNNRTPQRVVKHKTLTALFLCFYLYIIRDFNIIPTNKFIKEKEKTWKYIFFISLPSKTQHHLERFL